MHCSCFIEFIIDILRATLSYSRSMIVINFTYFGNPTSKSTITCDRMFSLSVCGALVIGNRANYIITSFHFNQDF